MNASKDWERDGREAHERGVHERLCALVLGELEPAESAALERELALSPELRAERARIEATLRLVREVGAGGEGLSDETLARLGAAASPQKPWYAARWLRAAAGFALFASAIVALHEATKSGALPPASEELARLEDSAVTRQARSGGRVNSTSPEAAAVREDRAAAIEIAEEPSPIDVSSLAAAQGVRDLLERSSTQPQGDAGARGYQFQTGADVELDGESMDMSGLAHGGEWGDFSDYIGLVTPETHSGDGGNLRRIEKSSAGGVLAGGAGGLVAGSRGPERSAASTSSGPATPGPKGVAPSAPNVAASGQAPAGGADDAILGLGPSARSRPEDLRSGSAGFDLYFHDHERRERGQIERRALSPAEREVLAEARAARILAECRRRPHERPGAMYFRFWGDNPFELARLDPFSTFAVDVDTASYALARRYLAAGHLPERAQVRTEEFVNYFAPDVPAPLEGTFAVHADLAPSRFGQSSERWMLRVVVRGKEIARGERQPLALTFVIDTSGSMAREKRMELVQHSLRLLAAELDARDSIAIVAFSTDARIVLPMTSAANRSLIESAIHELRPDGWTNTEAGLKLGYEIARAALSSAAQNRVVLLSDGVANRGETDPERLGEGVRKHREAGIFLNTVGVGFGNHNDVLLEQLANKGDGVCNYVDGPQEARRALVDNFTGAFQTIARDVKVQVEFDPERVHRYRLLGYENRAIADRDFRNDAVDAGEIGAGHQVTALYELELARTPVAGEPLATVRLRWKQPTGAGRDPLEDVAEEGEMHVDGARATSWEGSAPAYRRAVIVARFAEVLRRSTHAREVALDELLAEARKLERELADPDFGEFVTLLEQAQRLALPSLRPHDPLERCIELLRHNCILRAELEDLPGPPARDIEDLERQARELEARIRALVRVSFR